MHTRDLVHNLGWWINIRWLAGISVLVATWAAGNLLGLQLAVVPLYALGTSILMYNILFRLAWQQLQRETVLSMARACRLAHVQVAADWAVMISLIHLSGGIESPAILYFFFHIALAAIELSARATYWYATLVSVLVGGMALLEYAGILPHVPVGGFLTAPLYQHPGYVVGVLFFFNSTVFVVAYLAVGTTRRLRRREAEIVALSGDLQRAYNRLQTLYDTARASSSTLEMKQVLDQLANDTTRAMGVRACSIHLLDETGTRLVVAAAHGLSDVHMQKGGIILDRDPVARQALSAKTVIVNDGGGEQGLQFPAETMAEGIRSMLTVALPGKNKRLGLIRAYSMEPNHFTEDDASFLTAIASQGSIAIENAMAYEQLSQLDQEKSRFVLTVTHELRSPVGVVRSLLRTMLSGYSGSMPDVQHEMVARALHRADFLQTLIDDLLDLAAGKTNLRTPELPEPVQLNQAVERVAKRFQIPSQERHILLEWRTECEGQSGPIMIWATDAGVDRVLNNLVSNAVKYTPEGGRVSVTLRRTNGDAYVQVSDTGIGISEEAMPHLFEEFYRAPNAKALEKEGTGLGLTITRDLIAHYHGRITVQSQAGQGTTFTVIWPTMRDA